MTPETIRKNPHASEHCPKREGDEGATQNNRIPQSTTHDKEHRNGLARQSEKKHKAQD
jgi:hypothetical protein